MSKRGLTQSKLERRSGISQGTISKTLNAENLKGITGVTVLLLAAALDVPVGWLLAGEGDSVPSRGSDDREPESGVAPSARHS
jgi:transcriptional regulator with XRE-family HTH domain